MRISKTSGQTSDKMSNVWPLVILVIFARLVIAAAALAVLVIVATVATDLL